MFGLIRVSMNVIFVLDTFSLPNILHWASFLVLCSVFAFYWLKSPSQVFSEVQKDKMSKKESYANPTGFSAITLQCEMFNLVYVIILLGVIGVVYALFLHGENIIVLIIVVLLPLMAAGQSLCQIIHFAHRKSTKGVSVLTTVLIWMGPFFSSVAIVCFLLADPRNWHPMLYFVLYTDLPANIVSFLMVFFIFVTHLLGCLVLFLQGAQLSQIGSKRRGLKRYCKLIKIDELDENNSIKIGNI